MIYEKGDGIEVNERDAFRYFQKAAELYHGEARYRLGTMYKKGKGVKQDKSEAVKWFQLAEKVGYSEKKDIATIVHFGTKIKKSDGFKLTRDNYCRRNNKSSLQKYKLYSDDWCDRHYQNCMENFDLNMKYLAKLNAKEFKQAITTFLNQNKQFIKITDLSTCTERRGYYLMVLDGYKQAYIGISNTMKNRILNHWNKIKEFDRLILGNVHSSLLSIDSFRALDTTRLYAFFTENIHIDEDNYISSIPTKFMANRASGGLMEDGLSGALATAKTRSLE